jgi:hypothetical protein
MHSTTNSDQDGERPETISNEEGRIDIVIMIFFFSCHASSAFPTVFHCLFTILLTKDIMTTRPYQLVLIIDGEEIYSSSSTHFSVASKVLKCWMTLKVGRIKERSRKLVGALV